jgi:hypothetical protein
LRCLPIPGRHRSSGGEAVSGAARKERCTLYRQRRELQTVQRVGTVVEAAAQACHCQHGAMGAQWQGGCKVMQPGKEQQ